MRRLVFAAACGLLACAPACLAAQQGNEKQSLTLRGDAGGPRFDGIGVVDGGGGTSVLLKDYPEPQRSQILDLLYKPKFGASVSALLVEIPGDGNSTQGSMPSHMHTREDLNFHRGYTWWVLQQAKRRNPDLTMAGMAWSAPRWVGNGEFWSADTAEYYAQWLKGLKSVYGLELNSLGMRNERGVNFGFAGQVRSALKANGFSQVKLQGFDNWPEDKLQPFKEMLTDPQKRNALDILSAHTLVDTPAKDGDKLRQWGQEMHKPIWNSEEHVYKKGFDAEISLVQGFNLNYIRYGTSLVVNWYGIAGVYPLEPYSETPAALLARSPWSGHYVAREALWGYAHYGQFTQAGWSYLDGGYGLLANGGSYVTLKSPGADYSMIVETKEAKSAQELSFRTENGLASGDVHVWRSNAAEQFTQQATLHPVNGVYTLTLDPESVYSLTTTSGQQKGSFPDVPADAPFPLPYREDFEEYTHPEAYGFLPRYTADIEESFELADRPDHRGRALHQAVPMTPLSWAPEWQPYTILGDANWTDYEVSADISVQPGESAGVMGRVNEVGTGYGVIPKGYFLDLSAEGLCRLVVVRGKREKKTAVGDAEQQALIAASKDQSEGGELVLASKQVPDATASEWHRLTLRFQGTSITGLVDGRTVVQAQDALYAKGMAGLLAGREGNRLSMPYFDDLAIAAPATPKAAAAGKLPLLSPIYGGGCLPSSPRADARCQAR